MRNGLLLGLDGAGKTLLLRQVALQLSRSHRTLRDRLVLAARRATCLTGATEAVLNTTAAALTPFHVPLFHGAALLDGPSPRDGGVDPTTQPTIGVEHTPLTIEGKSFSLCEVGGQLLPMWKAYYATAEFWVYVVDLSEPAQIAGAAIEFFNIMRHDLMRRKPKLLVFNKMDACFSLDDSLLRAYFCLDRLLTDAHTPGSTSGPMHVLKVSALSGENVDAVAKWIHQRATASNNAMHGGPSSAQLAPNRTTSRTERPHRVHPVAN
ncbi:hypothetical protein P43SY_005419 [Pythium insidiosum]|uniref:ADP-ribosylation factor-like protein 16 n=1 Tax=Pythium insidiosum TaxID=114742 RepID=A0AAD5L7L7_PYTIN|nr:hypothetical protein P43SY_005419 [Pythium insidiosum]